MNEIEPIFRKRRGLVFMIEVKKLTTGELDTWDRRGDNKIFDSLPVTYSMGAKGVSFIQLSRATVEGR